jgi:IS30 family transposase
MTTHYTHLTVEERVTLMIMRLQGSSLRNIAAVPERHPSTLSRDVRRQPGSGYYDASAAGARTRALRHVLRRRKILAPDSELFHVIRSLLAKGWSPEQIAARLKVYWPDNPERHVSHETIYLTIYAYPRGELK